LLEQRNRQLRERFGNIPRWRVAEKLGIHEQTLVRWLRYELPEERKERIDAAINELKQEQTEQK
jgi:hypothetical protein